jgi:hypothetical protein
MNNWDKVDKKKRAATEDDVRWEYVSWWRWELFVHFMCIFCSFANSYTY